MAPKCRLVLKAQEGPQRYETGKGLWSSRELSKHYQQRAASPECPPQTDSDGG